MTASMISTNDIEREVAYRILDGAGCRYSFWEIASLCIAFLFV